MKSNGKKLKPNTLSASVALGLSAARAAAHKTARIHGTRIYVWKDGKVVALKP